MLDLITATVVTIVIFSFIALIIVNFLLWLIECLAAVSMSIVDKFIFKKQVTIPEAYRFLRFIVTLLTDRVMFALTSPTKMPKELRRRHVTRDHLILQFYFFCQKEIRFYWHAWIKRDHPSHLEYDIHYRHLYLEKLKHLN